MSEYYVICAVALAASALTFFSGFGLGTLLMPAFAAFFPLELAIALTAIVHFLNNLFKLFLVGRNASKQVVIRFGLPSVAGAICGALLLNALSETANAVSFRIFSVDFTSTLPKMVIGTLLVVFVLFELVPFLANLTFDRRQMAPGGLLSGFFGGLSGHQGALRSAFLVRAGLSKEAFIATGVVIACMVDVSRLSVYSRQLLHDVPPAAIPLLAAATLSAFTGAFAGRLLLKKITLKSLQVIVGMALLLFAVLMILGLV
jgi:uncharacterized protein